jgi:diguanylate cyclase (GGDEF)-like protein
LDRGEAWLLPLQGLTLPGGPQVVHLCLPWTEPLRSSLALCASLRRSSFATVLLDQRWREDWVVALLDSQCHIVARSINEAALLGRRAVAPMCQHIQRATAEGEAYQPNLVRARTLDGVESIGTAARVPRTAWWVAVGIPAQSVRDMAVGPLQRLLWGAAVAVLVAALGAFGLARSLVRQVAAAADQDDSQPLIVRELAQIAQRRHHAQRALHQARHDDLTSLPGRALFLEQLDTLVAAARTHAPTDVALLFLDLDGLKQTNDQIGHEAGDHLLQCTGHLLQSQLRQGDIAGRLGGDEFAVAFSGDPDTLGSAAHEVAQRLLRAVAGLGPGVGCSIGLARARPDQPPAQLLARADQAMLTAKRAGKNRVVEAD